MSEVFVERQFDPPIDADRLRKGFESATGCFEMHSVEWKGSCLSSDHADLFCHFDSADAESVRIALHQAGSPRGRVWVGSIHDAPGVTDEEIKRANVLVFRSLEAPSMRQDIQELELNYGGCMEFHGVRLLRSLLSTDLRRMVCFYRSPDAESLRILQRAANMPFDRILAIEQFHP